MVSYAQLKSGNIRINDKNIQTMNLSSYKKAVRISEILKDWIVHDKMTITAPLEQLPSIGSGYKQKLRTE
jgi:uncharacterized protein (DUF39 family)